MIVIFKTDSASSTMHIPCYLDSMQHKERVTHNRETNGGQSKRQARGARAGLLLSHRQRQTS